MTGRQTPTIRNQEGRRLDVNGDIQTGLINIGCDTRLIKLINEVGSTRRMALHPEPNNSGYVALADAPAQAISMFVWPDKVSLTVPRADGQRLASHGPFTLEKPRNLSTCHIHVKAGDLDDPATRRTAAKIIAESLDWSAVTSGRSPSAQEHRATPSYGPGCPHGMVGRNACDICHDE